MLLIMKESMIFKLFKISPFMVLEASYDTAITLSLVVHPRYVHQAINMHRVPMTHEYGINIFNSI